eukprot:TRINITY_DN610_c0_g3_i2.p1 TRINITY_DN610_c0_g3~~TRINITY_DN610_c0_g3_i2.p1  ORF type:complete len:292 (-),score=24.57 TRINITY_DN610_c0_g3_i2:99-974(-)
MNSSTVTLQKEVLIDTFNQISAGLRTPIQSSTTDFIAASCETFVQILVGEKNLDIAQALVQFTKEMEIKKKGKEIKKEENKSDETLILPSHTRDIQNSAYQTVGGTPKIPTPNGTGYHAVLFFGEVLTKIRDFCFDLDSTLKEDQLHSDKIMSKVITLWRQDKLTNSRLRSFARDLIQQEVQNKARIFFIQHCTSLRLLRNELAHPKVDLNEFAKNTQQLVDNWEELKKHDPHTRISNLEDLKVSLTILNQLYCKYCRQTDPLYLFAIYIEKNLKHERFGIHLYVYSFGSI